MIDYSPRIVATAGHIDHGKSTLVEALTGTDPDRLPEERRRGMTIELGFAHLDLPDPSAPGGGWHIGMVDVPGHADYVRNMAAGTGSADAALLTVAADDGWMPQTEEHFQILLHYGIHHGVVAITKADLGITDALLEQVQEKLAGTPWATAALVPVSAIAGDGLDELKRAVCLMLAAAPAPADIGRPRLFVDRVFSPRGVGTVATGTLTGGRLQSGAEVSILPGSVTGKVRGLQNHGKSVEAARPGMRTAVNLGGVEIAHDGIGAGIWRGHVIAAAGSTMSGVVHVELIRSNRQADAPALKNGQRIWVHCGTAALPGRVYLAGMRELSPGGRCLGEIRFQSPAAVECGDRFILRDISRRHTLAGGLVLETQARPRQWRTAAYARMLEQRAEHPADAAVWARARLECDGWLNADHFPGAHHFSREAIATALSSLTDTVQAGPFRCRADLWDACKKAAADRISAHHTAKPEDPGISLSVLRREIADTLPDAALFDPLLDALTADGFVRVTGMIRRKDFSPQLPAPVRQARARLRITLVREKFNPPKLSTYVTTQDEQDAIRAMLRSGEIFQLDDETAMLVSACDELRSLILTHLRQAGKATVAELRDATGSSRRILVPLCEKLDREGATRRSGDYRTAV